MAARKRANNSRKGAERAEPPRQPDTGADPLGNLQPTGAEPASRKPEHAGPPVVGIGASAGGLDAFRRFFTAMPADSGLAFVLVPHLDPGHESLMVELLARHTAMPVVEAGNDMPVQANHVYIIPPNKFMTIQRGRLILSGPLEPRTAPLAIDHFFRSLADDQRERAICIILSGTGSHGSLGLKAVKAAGGMALAQDPATAEHSAMPLSAVATGQADFVLPVEKMPKALLRYAQHAYVNGEPRAETAPQTIDQLSQILDLLRTHTRFDFRVYRKKMLTRRIERRVGLHHIESMSQYVAFLRNHPDEIKQLVKDLFISVTSFFRDPEAFEELAGEVLAPLVQSKIADGEVRVWVPGCATGEEAYSLTILLLEQLAAANKRCSLKVFATDVDPDALDVARQGIYPESIAADVSAERLARFFTRLDDSTYRVNKQVREAVTFAVQNLLADAPFSRMDLISCRNLLIYFEPEVQKKVVNLLHFALHPGGCLFLGPSETIGRQTDLFETVSKKWRIYRWISHARPERIAIPIVAPSEPTSRAPIGGEPGGERSFHLAELARRLVLEELGLAAVLVNRKYEILYFLGPTSRFLELPTGEPILNLMTMIRTEMRARLRIAIDEATRQNAPVVLADIQIKDSVDQRPARVTIRPAPALASSEDLLLITFQEQPQQTPALSLAAEETQVRQLEQELQATRTDLQVTIEELESSNEELKASNEEGIATNEELQSTNEELESAQEEMQSLNEELRTVNLQLQEKVQQLEAAHDDLANLFDSTEVATVFLNRELRIKRFTPAATQLYHFVASDVGRPLGDIKPRVRDSNLLDDVREVLQQLQPREVEVRSAEGRWWLRRITPYRTLSQRIEGVVITYADITERKQAADAVVRRLAAIVETSADAIFSKDLDGTIRTWNQGAERLYGYTHDEAVGQSVEMLVPQERAEEWADIMARLRRGEHVKMLETERLRKDGTRIPVALTISLVRDGSGQVLSASVIARDISDRKRAQETLRASNERLQAILSTAPDAIITIDAAGVIGSVNPAAEQMFGYTTQEMVGQNVKMLMPSPYREEHDAYLARYFHTGEKHVIGIIREVQGRHKNGSVFPVDLSVGQFEDLGKPMFTGIHRDLKQRKALEREVLEVADLEQQRIGQELHDTSAQELTALELLTDSVLPLLQDKAPGEARIVAKIGEGIHRVLGQVRAVSRGLIRVEVDAEGLMAALAELASQTTEQQGVPCTFDCKQPVHVEDNQTATQLYSIAREAVTNAIRHAQGRHIRISLEEVGHSITLRVQDDGIGFPAPPLPSGGMGLKIMRYRAGLINAHLAIDSAQPVGSIVTCTFSKGIPHGPKQGPAEKPPNPGADR